MGFRINLGSWVRDRVTGFEGLVTGRSEYLTGCNLLLIQPEVEDKRPADGRGGGSKWVDSRWIDEPRLIELQADRLTLSDLIQPDAPLLRAAGADREAPKR